MCHAEGRYLTRCVSGYCTSENGSHSPNSNLRRWRRRDRQTYQDLRASVSRRWRACRGLAKQALHDLRSSYSGGSSTTAAKSVRASGCVTALRQWRKPGRPGNQQTGNRLVRALLIEMAGSWVRYQGGS